MYLCQNDGTLMSSDYALKYPILTISSGPTNSIRGAAYLSELKNAMTLDIGGTTSDLGVLQNYFPRESSASVQIGGVQTNFRMPDIVSVGIGGGSIVHRNTQGQVTVGPDSVGYKINDKALVFGGDVLTATDVAVKLGFIELGDKNRLKDLSLDLAKEAMEDIKSKIELSIDQIKTNDEDVTLVLIGGGSLICPSELRGVSKILRNTLGPVANAIGASIAQISGEFEQIYTYNTVPREQALLDARQKAEKRAIDAGAEKSSLELVEIEEVPLSYFPGEANRVKIKMVGTLSI